MSTHQPHISRISSLGILPLAFLLACGGGGGTGNTPVVTGVATPAAGGAALSVDQEVDGTTVGRRDTSSPSCGEPDGGGDQAWSFTPEEDGWFHFHVDADYDAVLVVRGDGGSELGCNDDGETKREAEVFLELAAGQTYSVVVDGYRASEGTYRLQVAATEQMLPPGVRGRLVVDQVVSDATTDGTDSVTPNCGAQAGSRDHVWQFVAPTAGSYRFLVEAEFDSVVALTEATGAALDCNDDFGGSTDRSQVTRMLAEGQTVRVVVDGYSGREGAYRLTATNLSGAVGGGTGGPATQGGVVTVGTPVNGTTAGGQDHFTPSCGASTQSPDNVWEFTPTEAGTFRVHVDSQYDAVVSLWDARGIEVACNDDLNSTSDSEVIVGLMAGQTYSVVVDGYNGATGTYRLEVGPDTTAPPPPPPTTAAFQTSGRVRLNRPTSDSIVGGTDMVQVGCNSAAGTPDDIWELTVPRRGDYQILVDAQFDSVVALLDAQHNEISCNDDHRTTRQSLVRAPLVRGQTYYVVVTGYQSEEGGYVLTVSREPKPGRRP